MKNTTILIFCMLSSVWSYSQSISLDPNSQTEGRRNQEAYLRIVGIGTHFAGSSSLIVSLKSTVDGSILSSTNFTASGNNIYCSGSFVIPPTATPGLYNLSIYTTNEGKLNLPYAFTVTHQSPKPQIIDLSPKTATQGEQVKMTIVARYAMFKKSSTIGVYLYNDNSILSGLDGDSIVVVNDSTIKVNFNIPEYRRSWDCTIRVSTDSEYFYADGSQLFFINGSNPQIESVSPDSATDSSHVDMTIRCTQTRFTAESDLNVYLSNAPVYPIVTTVVNDSTLIASFNIPVHTQSCVSDLDIVSSLAGVIHKSGVITITERYPKPKPAITDVSPYFGKRGARHHIIVTGKNLHLSDTTIIRTEGLYGPSQTIIRADTLEILNDSQFSFIVTIPFSAPLELYYLTIDIDYVHFDLFNVFTVVEDEYPNPYLTSVTPNSAIRGQSLDLTITGIGTHFTRVPTQQVSLAGLNGWYSAVSSTALNDTVLYCRFELPKSAKRDVYDLVVHDGSRGLLLVNGFNIVSDTSDPRLVSVSPAITSPGKIFDVVVSGYNTHFLELTDHIALSVFSPSEEVQATSSRRVNDTTLEARFEIPENFPLGKYDFGIVSDAYGFMNLPLAITVRETNGLSNGTRLFANLYPNPVHDNLYIDTKYPVRACTIVDITGKQTVVDPNEFKQYNTQIIIPIDKLGLHKGIYFIRLDSDTGFDYKKFVVE